MRQISVRSRKRKVTQLNYLFGNLQGNSIFRCKYFNQGFYTDNNSSNKTKSKKWFLEYKVIHDLNF